MADKQEKRPAEESEKKNLGGKRSLFDRLLADKRMRQLFSVIMAVFVWLLVAMTINNQTTVAVSNVPVVLDPDYISRGLEEDAEPASVSVQVTGPRTTVGLITANDILVTADTSQVNAPYTYPLTLTASFRDAGYEADPEMQVTVDQPTVTVKFNRTQNEAFTIDANLPDDMNTRMDTDRYMEGEVSISPAEVTISGSEDQIARIDRVVLQYELPDAIEDTLRFEELPIQLLDAAGRVIDPEEAGLVLSTETANLTIEILYIKEIPFKVEYVNVPAAFPIDLMPHTLSPASITVAGPREEVERLGSWSLAEIDLHDIDLEYTHIFRIEMPEGFINIDGVETVIWEFDPLSVDRFSEVTISIQNEQQFRVINEPDAAMYSWDYVARSPQIDNIRIIGLNELVDSIDPYEIIAVIDGNLLRPGQRQVQVQIETPGGLLWAYGDYAIAMRVDPVEEETG